MKSFVDIEHKIVSAAEIIITFFEFYAKHLQLP